MDGIIVWKCPPSSCYYKDGKWTPTDNKDPNFKKGQVVNVQCNLPQQKPKSNINNLSDEEKMKIMQKN